jgi:quercetin dioxygenase-like cupin family protein
MPSQPPSGPPAAGPADAKVEFENESIIVVRVRMAPHEKTPMHDIASARLVVWLTDVHLRDTHPDGSANEIHRRAGTIYWVGVQRHAGENLSHEPLEFLAIVPKTGRQAAPR